MKVKICGLSNPEHVKTCINFNADFCGFILNYPKSHRFISFEKAHELTSIKKNKTQYVGVLVEPNEEELIKYSKLKIDYFQIYGNFSRENIISFKSKFKKKIIFTIQVKSQKDVEKYKYYENAADIILFDSSGLEKSISWNFNWIKNIPITKMVAGNVDIDKLDNISNLADIVDVSGALETNKLKDTDKIKKFLNKIKEINDKN